MLADYCHRVDFAIESAFSQRFSTNLKHRFAMLPRRSLSRLRIISVIVSAILAVVVVVVGFSSISGQDRSLVDGKTGYRITGQFAVKGTPRLKRPSVEVAESRSPGIVLWGSGVGDSKKQTGTLISPTFESPAILSLFVAGYPKTPGVQIFLERVDTQKQLNLKVGTAGDRWQDLYWFMPADWRGRSVRLVAIDGATTPTAWFGISSPLETGLLNFLARQIPSLILIPLYFIQLGLFLLPGLPLAIQVVRQSKLNSSVALMLGIALSSLVSYAAFWSYFINPVFGIVFSVLIFLISLGYALFLGRKRGLVKILSSVDIIFPFLLMLIVGSGYLLILYIGHTGESPEILAQARFFDGPFPPDNVLPKIFADNLYQGTDPRPLFGEWLSSDRPPLQAGISLLQRPLIALTGLPGGLRYQVLGTIAQCSWVAAIWALCRTLRLSGLRIAIVLPFCIFSGFFLFHSVYVWPKLLAGALVVFAFTLLLPAISESRRPSAIEVGLATGATALGMLAHGGVVFTVPALITMVLVKPKSYPGIRQLLIGCLIFGLLLAPWSAYQKFYEPPGNRLVKWHLAGVTDPSDHRSSLQAILDSYRSLSATQFAFRKWTNITTLLGDSPGLANDSSLRRSNGYFYVFRGLGILNVGWLVLMFGLFKQLDPAGEMKKIRVLIEAILVSLLFWALVMFELRATTIHQGSYATMILLFTVLAALLSKLPRWLCYFLLSFQLLFFVLDWIISPLINTETMIMVAPNLLMVGLVIVCTIGVIRILWTLSQTQLPQNQSVLEADILISSSAPKEAMSEL
ncbi:MAG: hypothetical protein WCA35_28045 [Kovacikia sp.]